MSIRPIDIQTLLAQMSQVGKDQAVEKQGAALTAAIKGAEDQKKRDEAKEAIHRAEDNEVRTEPIKDRTGGAPEHEGSEGQEAKPGEGQAETEEIVRDPNLGKHIDLTG
jgi:hypothetical protein